jgi:regulator of sirC expression with transglutaminase-like and TPR domain
MSDEQAFAALSRRACPPVGEALFAVAAAWRPVNWPALDAQLDELALPLFATEPTGRERAGALAELLVAGFARDAKPVDGLWLDAVLATRRGHPLLLAAIATELGRRAGWEVAVCSSPTAWFAGLHHEGTLWLVDPTGETSGEGAPKTVRRHCAHEVAFVVLTGLAERFAGTRDEEQARRLRDRLDVFAP